MGVPMHRPWQTCASFAPAGLSAQLRPAPRSCCPPPAAGEKAALAGNGRGGLATVALRPSGIFGEGDMLLVPTTVRNAQRGKMKYVIGSGRNEMDWTYVGNVAQVGAGGGLAWGALQTAPLHVAGGGGGARGGQGAWSGVICLLWLVGAVELM